MVKKFNECLTKKFPRLNTMKPTDLYLIAFIITISLTIFIFAFKNIFSFELGRPYGPDNPLFWAVGRGILNGLAPYSQLYENKPPGIFLLSALSFALTDEVIIGNIISCLSALVIAVVPALVVFDLIKSDDKKEGSVVKKAFVILTVFLSGLLIAVYSETRSGGFQVEEIGAAFSVLFILFTVKLGNAKSRKKVIIFTVLASLMISCAVMMKEPFLLVAVVGALLFVNSIKDFLKRIIIPCFAGGAFTVILLAVFGVLDSYLNIYVKRMFETRLSGESSAFSRAVNIFRLSDDLKKFSYLLLFFVLVFLILSLVRVINKKEHDWRICLHALKVFAAIYIASFCVGMGGQYFIHHYEFAVPVYCAFIICGGAALYEINLKSAAKNGAVIMLWGMAVFSAFLNMSVSNANDYFHEYNEIKEKAEYVDSLLDYYNEDTYQYIGFVGDRRLFIGLTKHSPKGPVFAQDPDNMSDKNSWFSQRFMKQLDEANIIIVDSDKYYSLNWDLRNIIDTNFSETPAIKNDLKPPASFNYTVFYRVSEFG